MLKGRAAFLKRMENYPEILGVGKRAQKSEKLIKNFIFETQKLDSNIYSDQHSQNRTPDPEKILLEESER